MLAKARKNEIMDRNPPEKVKKILRQEVRFACPIPGCANPVLTWHHFDPPWCDEQHHNPKGMIALCTSHHPLADGGTWSRSQLRSFKQNPPEIESIRKKFLWSESKVLYRLGGNYAANCPYIITISGTPIVWHTTSKEGRILFSLDIRDEDSSQILLLEENFLSLEYHKISDLFINTYENHLKVWSGTRKVGLELRLCHLSLQELSAQLEKDSIKALSTIEELMPHLKEIMPKPDFTDIFDFAKSECIDTDNKVAILDVLNATLFGPGKCVKVRNGIVAGSEFQFCFSHSNGGAAFSF